MIKRFISLFISLILLFQCIPLAYADEDINANAAGNGNASVQTGTGANWKYTQSGFRITILDTTGKPASNSVDILFSTSISANIWCWNSKVESLKITDGKRVNIIRPVDEVVNKLQSPQLPYPMTWSNGPVAQGTAVRQWMLGNEIDLNKGPSSQSTQYKKSYSNAVKTIKEIKKTYPETEVKKIDYTQTYNNLTTSFQINLEIIIKDWYDFDYSYGDVLQGMYYIKNNTLNDLRNTGVYTEEQLNILSVRFSNVIRTLKEKYRNYKPASKKKLSLDGLFMIAYADDTPNEKPAWIKKLINYEVKGELIFVFKDKTIVENGDAPIDTVIKNHFKILVEPIEVVKADNGDRIYGTITNINEYFYTEGIYSNYISGVASVANRVGPYSLSLEQDEVFTDLTFKAPPTNTYVEGKGLEISAKKFTEESSASANPIIGYAMHCYSLNHEDEGATHTWDWEKEELKDGEPGNAPEYIPDAPTGSTVKQVSRIVKVYEVETVEGIEHLETFERVNTVSVIQIEDEPQYKLIEWRYGTPNNPVNKDTTWDEAIYNVPSTNSGTNEGLVDIKNENDSSQTTTLYVRLRLPLKDEPKTEQKNDAIQANEDLTESQLTKISNTNSATFGWDKNIFHASITQAKVSHDFTHHKTILIPCDADYTDSHSMSRSIGDPIVSATFAILTKDNHETTVATPSAHTDFEGKTWGKGTETADSIEYKQSIGDGSYSWDLVSDGSREDGVEYITTISRASIKDIANIALYKKDAMYKDSYDRIETIFPESNISKNTRKGNGVYTSKLNYIFGHLVFDNSATSSCGQDSPEHHGSHTLYDDTKFVSYNTQRFDLKGDFNIWVYGGNKAKEASISSTIQPTGFTVLHGSNAVNISNDGDAKTALYHSKQKATIKFYPYIRMSYMITEDNKIFEGYESFSGYKVAPTAEQSRTVYMLSTKQSTITPTNAVEVSWDNQAQMNGRYGLQMTSQQWSTHARATSGQDWRQKNQVLPGGAMYQLKTDNTETTVKTVTYNTLIDDDSRKWITVSDSNKYTVLSIINSTQNYLKEAEKVMENYRIVQWINNSWDAEYAWSGVSGNKVKIKSGGESLSNLGLGTKASTESKYLLTNGTEKNNNINEADIDIIGKSYNTVVYKGYTDIQGNVYVVWVSIQADKNMLTENDLNAAVNYLKPICGTSQAAISNLPSNMKYNSPVLIGKKNESLDTILNSLKANHNEIYQMNAKTGWVSNLVNSVERNTGNDLNATWLNARDGKWYNEAFDGYYMVVQQAYYKVGINIPKLRQAVLDPNFCPAKSSTSDVFSTAYASQFRLNEKSSVAEDKEDGYLGTFEDMTVIIPNLPMMMYSRIFYIPNANVQDLS